MKTFKLNKQMIENLSHMLTKVGAVQDKQAYPSYVFLNPIDCKAIQKALYKQFKKEYPGLRKKQADLTVGMHWLNLGPVECVGVKPGYLLFDQHAMAAEIASLKKISK